MDKRLYLHDANGLEIMVGDRVRFLGNCESCPSDGIITNLCFAYETEITFVSDRAKPELAEDWVSSDGLMVRFDDGEEVQVRSFDLAKLCPEMKVA